MQQDLASHYDTLYAIAYNICKDKNLAQDAVQDTYLKVYSTNIELTLHELEKICKTISLDLKDGNTKNIAKPLIATSTNGSDISGFIIEQLSQKEEFSFEISEGIKKEKEKAEMDRVHKIESLTLPGIFLDFETAREYIRTLELQSEDEWAEFRRTYRRPRNIPFHPNIIYKEKWKGTQDWLGYALWEYEECRVWVQAHLVPKGIDSYPKWNKMDKSILPRQIPKDPYDYFTRKGEWKNNADFFGIKRSNPSRGVISKEEGILIIQEELLPGGIDSNGKYERYMKELLEKDPDHKHLKLPRDPAKIWGLKWSEIWKMAGRAEKNESVKNLLPYKEARTWVRFNLVIPFGINARRKWAAYRRGEYPDAPPLPNNIPKDLQKGYKDKGWDGYGAFFGTFATDKKKWWTFERARKWIAENVPKEKVFDSESWEEYSKGNMPDLPSLPSEIPPDPWRKYKEQGYKNIQHWLGQKEWELAEAKKWALENLVTCGIDNPQKYYFYLKGRYPDAPPLPDGFPKAPGRYFNDKNIWKHFLGTKEEQEKARNKAETDFIKSVPRGTILKFNEAKLFVRKFLVPKGIDTLGKYVQYKDRPRFLPERPDITYFNKGWTTINDFFGTNYENALEEKV